MKTVEVRHPLVQHKIGLLRQAALNTKDFRELVTELGTLLAYEATADLETEPATMDGWAGPVQGRRIAGAKITVVPILRAGLGMLPGVLALIPAARVSVVGLQRDEATLQPVPYFERLTGRLDQRDALILDPMLATGGTLIATIMLLVVIFAQVFLTLDHTAPGSFSQELNKMGALYFSMTVTATVGFGDIVAKTDTARAVVTFQMFINLVLLAAALRGLITVAQTHAKPRFLAQPDRSPDEPPDAST